MGKVRSDHVKKMSRKLVQRFPERFTKDFENNKKALEDLTNIHSKKLRNQIAGYITRIIARNVRSVPVVEKN